MKKILFLFIVLIGILHACDSDCNSSIKFDSTFSGAIRSNTFNASNDDTSIDLTTVRKSISNRTTISMPIVSLHSDIDYYWLNNPQDGIGNISLPYLDETIKTDLTHGYQINALYSAINVGDFTWYHGAVPFKGGRFSEIKDPTVNGGNGLAIINNQVYMSDFLKYNTSFRDGDFNILFGKSEFDTKLKYNGLLQKNDGSSGEYLLITYENNNHFLEFDYFDMTGKVSQNNFEIEPWKIKLFGIGYIFDDSLDSGATLYANMGYSKTDDNSEMMAKSYNIPSAYFPYLKNQGASIGNYEDQTGYAVLLGANYEFDTLDYTFNIGTEFFKTWGAWVSTNHGVAFQSDHSWYANRNAQEYTLYAGVDINKHLRLSTKYVHTDAQSVPNAFSITQNSDYDSAFNKDKFFTHFDKLEFLINYVF